MAQKTGLRLNGSFALQWKDARSLLPWRARFHPSRDFPNGAFPTKQRLNRSFALHLKRRGGLFLRAERCLSGRIGLEVGVGFAAENPGFKRGAFGIEAVQQGSFGRGRGSEGLAVVEVAGPGGGISGVGLGEGEEETGSAVSFLMDPLVGVGEGEVGGLG